MLTTRGPAPRPTVITHRLLLLPMLFPFTPRFSPHELGALPARPLAAVVVVVVVRRTLADAGRTILAVQSQHSVLVPIPPACALPTLGPGMSDRCGPAQGPCCRTKKKETYARFCMRACLLCVSCHGVATADATASCGSLRFLAIPRPPKRSAHARPPSTSCPASTRRGSPSWRVGSGHHRVGARPRAEQRICS
ncbi:hypothetical protein PYCCODRAFT_1225525 [Trametes coccinea BRFM310]|uniref:Uncharacterized protein n=1 Tax=Trametes coccinea (strain BRFM310) TaxID=1353009 RepID=A0A1Y2IXF7_TRAC3|nr:hypothetical protein PYCCODRAFT_1225525 [Trametes coccinea BRFM310]